MIVSHTSGQSKIPDNATIIDLRGSDEMSVDMQDIAWLTEASYVRVGPDLVLENTSGEQAFLIGYYDAPQPMDLVGTGGAKIPAHIVDILDGSQTTGQYAQAGTTANSEPIGQAETVEGSVYAVHVDGTRVQLKQGDDIFQGDTLETGDDGIIGVTFADESTLSLDADARMVIDEMVYEPGGEDGSASMFVLQGAMSFVSGSIAKANPDAMSIETPIATIGIRGTSVLVSATPAEDGETEPNQAGGEPGSGSPMQVSIIMLPEANGDGSTFTGEVVITTSGGSQVIGGGFQGTSISNPNQAPPAPQVVSVMEIGRVFGAVVAANPNKGSVPTTLRQAVEKVLVQMDAEKAVADAKKAVDDLKKEVAAKKEAGEDTEALEGELALAESEAGQAQGELVEAEKDVIKVADDLGEEMGVIGLADPTNLTGANTDPVASPVDPVNNVPKNDPTDIPVTLNDTPPPPGPVFVAPGIPIVEPVKPIVFVPPTTTQETTQQEDPDPVLPNANAFTIAGTEEIASTFLLSQIQAETDGVIEKVAGQVVNAGTAWGTALVMTDGSLAFDGSVFTFTPNTDVAGIVPIPYTARNSDGITTSAVNLDLANVNDAPTFLGDGLDFSAGGFVNGGTVGDLTGGSDLTVHTFEAWVKIPSGSYDWPGIFGTSGTTFTPVSGVDDPWIQFNLRANQGLTVSTWDGSASAEMNTVSAGMYPQGSWAHIAYTYDGSTLTSYVNGTAVASGALSGLVIPAASEINFASDRLLGGGFPGEMAEVRIWNTDKSVDIANESYRYNELNGNETNLIGYFPLDEGAGTSVKDMVHNTDHNIITGSPPSSNAIEGTDYNWLETDSRPQLTNEDTAFTGSVLATDVDSADTLTYSTTNGTNGTVSIDALGNYTYTSNTNYNGADSFTVTVSDGTLTDTQTINVTVAAVNDAPVISVTNFDSVVEYGSDQSMLSGELVDVDNDGDLDIVYIKNSGTLTSDAQGDLLYKLNDGSGNFGADTLALAGVDAGNNTMEAADLNGDGIQDLYAANGTTGKVLFGMGDGTFTDSGQSLSNFIGQAFLTLDGNSDTHIVTGSSGNGIVLHTNNGSGTFSTGTAFGGAHQYRAINVGDFNGDGKTDVVAGEWNQPTEIYFGDGAGGFTYHMDLGTTGNGATQDLEVADFNNDGYLDVYMNNRSAADKLYLNDGSGNFSLSWEDSDTATIQTFSDIGDINGDGFMDVVIATDANDTVMINNGDGTFTRDASGPSNVGRGVDIGDLNGDGSDDVFLQHNGANSEIALNYLGITGGKPLSAPEGQGYKPFSDMTISDADSTSFIDIELNVGTGLTTGTDLFFTASPTGLTGVYNSGTGILTYTGTTIAANYHTALDSVSLNLNAGNHTFTATIKDDAGLSGTSSIEVTVSPSQEDLANTVTIDAQQNSEIAALGDGGWVVTWQSNGQDANLNGIYGQIYNSDGSKRGTEFQANDYETENQRNPRAVGLSDGTFVIGWDTYNQPGDNFAGTIIKKYDASGTALSTEIRPNDVISLNESDVQMVALANGEFALTYVSDAVNYSEVYFKVFDNANTPTAYVDVDSVTAGNQAEVILNEFHTQHQLRQSMSLSGDNVLTVWASHDAGATKLDIFGKIYNNATDTFGAEFQINTTTGINWDYTDLTTLSTGEFVAVWRGPNSVVGRIISATGTPGTEITINQTATDSGTYPQIAGLNNGKFVVVWESSGDSSGYGIYARIYNGDGTPDPSVNFGNAFLVNETLSGDQKQPSIAVLSDGDFIISWSSDAQDGADLGIFMTRFNPDGTTHCDGVDPLIFDLDGDGVEMLSAADGIAFDADADGDKEQIGWVGADDGLLVSDLNGDGQINDMSEVISPEFNKGDKNDGTVTSSLEVLSLYDDNKDGVIDAQDDIYQDLQIWQDRDSDGVTDEGELTSLANIGITSIELDHDEANTSLNGNAISKEGTVTFEDGTQTEWAEVAFSIDDQEAEVEPIFDEIGLFNEIVVPLLDKDDAMAVVANAELPTTDTGVIEQSFDEMSLLKEIVGPMMDADTMPTFTNSELSEPALSIEAIPFLFVVEHSENDISPTSDSETVSYTSTPSVEEVITSPAAE